MLIKYKDVCAKAHPTHANAFPSRLALKIKYLLFAIPSAQGAPSLTPQNEIVLNKPGVYFLEEEPYVNDECSWVQTTKLDQERCDDNSRAKTMLCKACCHLWVDISQL